MLDVHTHSSDITSPKVSSQKITQLDLRSPLEPVEKEPRISPGVSISVVDEDYWFTPCARSHDFGEEGEAVDTSCIDWDVVLHPYFPPVNSALDKINGRRILEMIKRATTESMSIQLFEINDQKTRKITKALVDSYLSLLEDRDAIEPDFQVICDESNNPPSAEAAGMLNVDVYVKTKSSIPVTHLEFSIGGSS